MYGQHEDVPNGIAQEMFVKELRKASTKFEEAKEEQMTKGFIPFEQRPGLILSYIKVWVQATTPKVYTDPSPYAIYERTRQKSERDRTILI